MRYAAASPRPTRRKLNTAFMPRLRLRAGTMKIWIAGRSEPSTSVARSGRAFVRREEVEKSPVTAKLLLAFAAAVLFLKAYANFFGPTQLKKAPASSLSRPQLPAINCV